jgi:hypothetical protein
MSLPAESGELQNRLGSWVRNSPRFVPFVSPGPDSVGSVSPTMTTRSLEEKSVRELDVSDLGQCPEDAVTQKRQSSEADSWWWLASLVLMAMGLYLLLTVHLLYDVVHASAPVWAAGFAVPVAFFIGAGLALGREAGLRLREQVRAIPAVLLGSAPLGSRPEELSKVQQSHGEKARR